jgi:short-subunit dehydrogenase
MDVSLKPLDQQVMVITGASSGIGLATALAAAKQGVKLVLGARSKQTLDEVVRHIDEQGGEAIAVQVDVGIDDEVRQLAAAALERFGRIDTWVNDAGLSIYGRIDEVGHKDSERMFQTNFWGVVYGSVAALPHLKSSGGTLINVGSEVSEATIPLQGMYSASKHAVKAFTDALRMELEADKAPVSVTLIQPTAVDTPFPEHAANYMSLEPKLPDADDRAGDGRQRDPGCGDRPDRQHQGRCDVGAEHDRWRSHAVARRGDGQDADRPSATRRAAAFARRDAVSRRRVRAGAWARQRERGVDRRSPARQPSIRVTTAL